MKRISKHISYREATFSITAIRKKLRNVPGHVQMRNMQTLSEKVFEPLRRHLGKPIKVTSFFRSPKVNVSIGGSKNSQHCKGEAIDLQTYNPNDFTNKDIYNWIVNNCEFDQIINEYPDKDGEPSWVHVSFVTRRKNRNQRLRVQRINGKSVYTQEKCEIRNVFGTMVTK